LRGWSSILATRRTAALLVITALFALQAAGGGAAPRSVAELRARDASLQATERSAALDLYALQSQLARTRERLASLRAQRETAEAHLTSLRIQLDVAWQSLYVAEERVGARIRQLYEHGQTSPVAVLLGAESLDEAITRLEGLRSLAAADREVVKQVRRARARLARAKRQVAARAAELRQAETAAAATSAALVAAQAERRDYLSRLAAERGFTRQRLAELRRVVQTARQRSARFTPQGPAVIDDAPQVSFEPSPTADGQTLTVVATGYSLRGRTATGLQTAWGVVAVDPGVIPLGTRMTIPGYGEGVAADTGGAVQGNTIDLWFPTTAQALAWGRRTVTITLH
jgi:3D (Asp-Asp-Asp) domain-containing protein/peptidoglycan hydrolase CwlO-like protein